MDAHLKKKKGLQGQLWCAMLIIHHDAIEFSLIQIDTKIISRQEAFHQRWTLFIQEALVRPQDKYLVISVIFDRENISHHLVNN